jgi:hypothetical protein
MTNRTPGCDNTAKPFEVTPMCRSRYLLSCSFLTLNLAAMPVLAMAQAAPTKIKAAAQPAENETTLPVRQVSLYKNGVGFFEQAGQVSGNELVRLDFTTAQLNDALQSLTAVDLGDGHVMGAGYNTSMPLALQLNQLAPGLGPDPTVTDLLRAMKGKRVEVRANGTVFAGRLLSVEVRREPEGKGSAVLVERRYVTVVTDAGGLRSFALTPSVEVRMTDGGQQEIGRYLSLLAESHEPSLRHLTLEDRGTGGRELHVSYMSAVPAWKSSYRILFSKPKPGADAKQTATLQGWAVVDNTSGVDWDNVQLTLVSGAPQSFIQQISRPLDVQRPQIGMPMPGDPAPKSPAKPRPFGIMGAMADPIGSASESVPMNASSIGGGVGVEVHRTQAAAPTPAPALQTVSDVTDYESAAEKTLAPQTTSVDLDDLFEYKLSKPITIRKSESATVPILQTEVAAERVTVWSGRGDSNSHAQQPMRALWLTNSSGLTLDRGSFSVLEDGVFGGEGQMDLLHPKQRQIVPYALDEAVTVDFAEPKPPAPAVAHIAVKDGRLSVHRLYPKVRVYTIHNAGATDRTVVLEPLKTERFQMSPASKRIAAGWDLAPGMPAPAEVTDKIYRFEVPVAANSTATFKLVETHSHPDHFELATMDTDDLRDVIHAMSADPDTVAKLQPVLDAKLRTADLNKQLKANKKQMDEVALEERRIRDNMASLKGTAGEQDLSKRYAQEMNQQEDKLAALQKDRDALTAQHDATAKQIDDMVGSLQLDSKLPAPVEKAGGPFMSASPS